MQPLVLILLVVAALSAQTFHSQHRPRYLHHRNRLAHLRAKAAKNKVEQLPIEDASSVDAVSRDDTSSVVTYTHIELGGKKNEGIELLVASTNEKLIVKLTEMKVSKNIDMKVINKGVEDGHIYYANDEDIERLCQNEKNNNKKTIIKSFPVKQSSSVAETYQNIGTTKKPVFLKSSKVGAAADYKSGVISEESLRRQGYLFDNLTILFNDEVSMQRLNTIALTLKNEYKLTSPEWKKWTNKTSAYNATSLTQVMAEYFSEYSIGDIGGEGANYIPRAGYPGTLAPGEKFNELYSIESLPKRILHPWPAMQEIQFHVRWPPSHPMIPPPLLWFGLNNMYTENFTNWELSQPYNDTIGGSFMTPKDAMRIARNHTFGASFVPEHQLEHGGMIFYNGHNIPHYNPDHGPTVGTEAAEPPIPKELLPLTERWLDPLHGIHADIDNQMTNLDSLVQEEAEEEEEIRRIAAEKILQEMSKTSKWQQVETESAAGLTQVQSKILDEYEDRALKRKSELGNILGVTNFEDIDSIRSDDGKHAEETLLPEIDRNRALRSAEDVHNLKLLQSGAARSPSKLIKYSIHVMEDTQREMIVLETDITNARRGKRRRKKKAANAEDELDIEVLPIEPVE